MPDVESNLTIERIVQVVRERGPVRNSELCAAFGVYGADPSRQLDRLLQKARKAGLLRVVGGKWVAAEVETADEKIARLTAERDAARQERDELQRAVDKALVDHSAVESERARLAREVEQLRSDLLRVTEERNAARESRRTMEFELGLLRDGPSRTTGAASTSEVTR